MARFLRCADLKSDREMSTTPTDPSEKRPRPDWYAHTVIFAAVGALALCLGSILTIRTHSATDNAGPAQARAAAVADMKPVVPWTADATVNPDGKPAPLREGPYSLKPATGVDASGGAFITLLGNSLSDDRFYVSQHANDNSFQGGDWHPENVVAGPDGVRLDVTRTGNPAKPFALAEAQVTGTYGYGRYEVIMRPAKGSGLVSTFFIFTGPPFGDPHDEIDIEFVGRDTDIVEFNYFRKGKTGHNARIKLPFDAALEDHLYAFDWTPDGIRWYIDGKLYYQTPEGDTNLPEKPGRIYFSNWTGIPQLRQWHGDPDFGERGSAYYSCISFTPLGENSRRCADIYRPETSFPAPLNQ